MKQTPQLSSVQFSACWWIFQSKVPYFVNATAGTTVYGAYDPLDKIADICQKYGLWMHVDGAWGGSALLSKKYRGLMNGIDRWGTKETMLKRCIYVTFTVRLQYIHITLHLHVIKELKIILTISFLIARIYICWLWAKLLNFLISYIQYQSEPT